MCEPAASGPDGAAPDGTEPAPTPLLPPADGVPELSVTVGQIADAARLLDRGHGPFAVDAERASGFRYSNRAYLIQIRRAGAGTVLIDPVSHGGDSLTALRPVADVLSEDEWILHGADQDLPCPAVPCRGGYAATGGVRHRAGRTAGRLRPGQLGGHDPTPARCGAGQRPRR